MHPFGQGFKVSHLISATQTVGELFQKSPSITRSSIVLAYNLNSLSDTYESLKAGSASEQKQGELRDFFFKPLPFAVPTLLRCRRVCQQPLQKRWNVQGRDQRLQLFMCCGLRWQDLRDRWAHTNLCHILTSCLGEINLHSFSSGKFLYLIAQGS